MHSPPRPPSSPPVLARRALMAGAGGALLFVTAGCNPFAAPAKVTQTVTASASSQADPMQALIATTRLHMVRMTNAIAADTTIAARLTPLRDDRQAHLAALITELSRSNPGAGAAEKATPTTGAVKIPTGSVALLAAARNDASTAQGQFLDAFGLASRYRAALFGSISACLATHRLALA